LIHFYKRVFGRLKMVMWLLVCVPGLASGQQDFQDLLDQVERDYKLLGVAAGAFSLDQPGWLLRGNLGRRMVEESTKIQDTDRFPLNDAGRSIVATLAARILEDPQGPELDWTWPPIGMVFPNTNPKNYNTTLLDLLVHNGGVPSEAQTYDTESAMDYVDSLWKRSNYSEGSESRNMEIRREAADFILANDFVAEKGTYSEFTYTVAISWLEHVLNDNFDNLLKKYVFDPLGMAGCGVGPTTLDPSLPPVEPWSHFAGPWGVYNLPITPSSKAAPPSAMAPDSGLVCPLDAIKTFLTAHLTRDESFLTAENWDLLHSQQGYLQGQYGRGIPYAPGFMILGQEGDRDVTQLYHEGSDGKSYSIVYINLDLNVGIVAFANTPIQGGMIQEVGWQRIVDYMAKEVGLEDDGRKQLTSL